MEVEAEEVMLRDAPVIPGLRFRHVLPEDAPALDSVHQHCVVHDRIDRLSSFEFAPTLEDHITWLADVVQHGTRMLEC